MHSGPAKPSIYTCKATPPPPFGFFLGWDPDFSLEKEEEEKKNKDDDEEEEEA